MIIVTGRLSCSIHIFSVITLPQAFLFVVLTQCSADVSLFTYDALVCLVIMFAGCFINKVFAHNLVECGWKPLVVPGKTDNRNARNKV